MNVTFQIQGSSPVTVACSPGDNLLELARLAGVAIDAPCSGNGSCGKCRVQLLEGELESGKSRHLSQAEYDAGWRLSCSCRIIGDCTVFVPDIAAAYQSRMKIQDVSDPREAQVFQRVRDNLLASGVSLENRFQGLLLQMDTPTLEDTLPDNERLVRAVKAAIGAKQVKIPYVVMKKLSQTLRTHDFCVYLKGRWEEETFLCMDLCAPVDRLLAGCAMDIGTTSVSLILVDLQTGERLAKGSAGNGQIRYGADVINRIIQQSRSGGQRKLQEAMISDTLNPILDNLCKTAGISPDSILHLAIGANTTMNHLLLGADASPVRMEPYIPSFFAWDDLVAGDLGLRANAAAPVVLAPNVGSYVGGDITAGTLASGIWHKEEMNLFIDLGTNGEIVFGNREFLMACACSAGPAFEGGDISCGMRATDGAVEACTIDPQTLAPKLSVIGPPGQKVVGICGSGIIDLIAELFRCGALDPRGVFCRENPRILRDSHGMARYVLAFPGESETGREVSLNEVDIDNFIRAKGAIYSAIDVLLQSVEMPMESIRRIYVAGGIGSGINIKNAISIGMLPDVELSKFRYIGNASLAGAWALVLSPDAKLFCGQMAANMTYLELSAWPGYMDAFVAACFLPHTDRGRFPNLNREG